MDQSLARGYAKMYLRSLPSNADISQRVSGKAGKHLLDIIDGTLGQRFQERPLRKLKAILGPHFENTEIIASHKRLAIASSVALSRGDSIGLMASKDANEPLFYEPSLEFFRLVLMCDREETTCVIQPSACLSQHALARLVQREAIEPDKLSLDARKPLYLADHVVYRMFKAKARGNVENRRFLIPFRGGALVTATVPRLAPPTGQFKESIGFQMSIRTWLPPTMLTEQHQECMTLLKRELDGLKIRQLRGPFFHDENRDQDAESALWKEIFEQNSSPWTPKKNELPADGDSALQLGRAGDSACSGTATAYGRSITS